MSEREDVEALDTEALVAQDLTYAIMRFYGYTEADIAEAESVHPGRVCSEDDCYDEDGRTVHPRAYNELGGTGSTVVEIVLPWLAVHDELVRADERKRLAGGDLGMVCDAYGLPHDAVGLARHLTSNAELTIGVWKDGWRGRWRRNEPPEGTHDHRCSDACAASEEHMRAMDLDAWRQIAELEDEDRLTEEE